MESMFIGCKALTSINFNNFITSSVTSMESMFKNCEELLFLNLTSFNNLLKKLLVCFMVVQN